MASLITQEDLALVLQQSAYRTCVLKVEVLDDATNKIIGTIQGIVSGTVSIAANSDIRRTANIVIQPTLVENIKLTEKSLLWLNKNIRMFVGLWNFRIKDYKWYPLGTYVYTDTSGTYDATNNQLTVNCADFMKKLDGTKNGQLGALKIKFPAYLENEETGEVIEYYHIRNAIIEVLETLARITKYRVDDIGEYYAMPEHNKDWQKYRENNPQWNAIPFDQEFASGCTVLSILTTLKDLYAGYEMYFDQEDNTFICQMIPTLYEDDVFLDNSFIQRVLISENKTVDMTTVRNICEVWGQVIETDFYNEAVSYSNNTYTCTIDGYEEKYYNGDTIALKIPSENKANPQVNVNGFGAVGIFDEATDSPLGEGRLKPDNVYAFKVKIKRDSETKTDVIKLYLLGQWQVHALDVLTDGTESKEKITSSDGTEYTLYSKEYFKKWYNVETLNMQVIPDSPFTVQKIGEILDVKTGGEFENITSDDLAADRARWENWKNCRFTDNISITTVFLPFLDVNKKVTYKPSDSDEEYQYIIQSVSHDFAGYKTSISMYRFYPLYIPDDDNELHVGD